MAFRADEADSERRAANPTPLKNRDPEASARRYLKRALPGAPRKSLAGPVTESGDSEFKSLGAEAVPLTSPTMVKFRRSFRKISVDALS